MSEVEHKWFADDCLLPPPHDTITKGYIDPVDSKRTSKDDYYVSKDPWCIDCKQAYQFTCMKDYQNIYYPYEEQAVFKKNFYKDYNNFLKDIDSLIRTNPNISKEKIQDAMFKGYSVGNFLDSCIALRLNHHRNCVRRKEDLYKPINKKYLEGDSTHKSHLNELNILKKLGNQVYTKAETYAKQNKFSVVNRRSKRKKNSRAKRNRSYKKSPLTNKLLEEKKNALRRTHN